MHEGSIMKVGFFCIGIGPSARPEVIDLIARNTEACGYFSLWAPEHIVLLDKYASSYPYTQTGRMPFEDLAVDFLDPYLALTYAAAVTKKIRLGTGISLVPERQPLTLAKEVATLDLLSNGRFDFGVGELHRPPVARDDEGAAFFDRPRQARDVVETERALAAREEEFVNGFNAEPGNAEQEFAIGDVDVHWEAIAICERPRKLGIDGKIEQAVRAGDDFVRFKAVEPHHPISLIQAVLAHERCGL